MSIFHRDETSWSAWTKAIEEFAGDPGAPFILQLSSVMQPLHVREDVHAKLAWYRKLMVGDCIPLYGCRNPNTQAGAPCRRVSTGYLHYLEALSQGALDRFVNTMDRRSVEGALRRYRTAQRTLQAFLLEANADWRRRRQTEPDCSREAWEELYGAPGYRGLLELAEGDVRRAYGEYRRLSAPYPQLAGIAQALGRMDTSAGTQVQLPASDEEVGLIGPEGWGHFVKGNIELGEAWSRFFDVDVIDARGVGPDSKPSAYYNHSWGGAGVGGQRFFMASGGDRGRALEARLARDTRAVRFSFGRLVNGTVTRGSWYAPKLVNTLPYSAYVDTAEFWGPSGVLNLVPVSVVVGRAPVIEIDTSEAAVEAYRGWRDASEGAVLGVGSFRIGEPGVSSTDWSRIRSDTSSTTLRLADTSGQAYVVGLVLAKMDEVSAVGRTVLDDAEADYRRFRIEEEQLAANLVRMDDGE